MRIDLSWSLVLVPFPSAHEADTVDEAVLENPHGPWDLCLEVDHRGVRILMERTA